MLHGGKTINPTEILVSLDRHAAWLQRQPNGARANFSLEDMSGFDLAAVMLSKAKLTGANLSCCNLRGGDLAEADLFGVD